MAKFSLSSVGSSSSNSSSITFNSVKNIFKTKIAGFAHIAVKNIGTFAFVGVVVIAVLIGIVQLIRVSNKGGATTLGKTTSQSVRTVQVDKEFSFDAYDKTKQIAKDKKVRYIVSDAQLTDSIVVKGQNASAVSGRQFLIVNLKLINEFDDSLFMNTRNYVRVQQQDSQDKLAPEIHNDTVEIQPLSTKMTRIGLPVSKDKNQFSLFVGEINGEKTEIPLQFPAQ